MNKKNLLIYIKKKYNTDIEYLWEKSPDSGIFRHFDNSNWFGAVLRVKKKVLGLDEEGFMDVLNLKCDTVWVCELKERQGAFPAYHMNKTHWISIALDGTFPDEDIKDLIEHSYQLTSSKKKRN